MTSWKSYQEEAADFFRSLGLSASTDVTLSGVRTKHDVDVFVKLVFAGFEATWIIECKYWKTAVTKLHVLALREIVSDLGADRGIILCEAGFQSGAVEAANLTNVQVTSLAALTGASKDAIYAARLRDLYDRTNPAGLDIGIFQKTSPSRRVFVSMSAVTSATLAHVSSTPQVNYWPAPSVVCTHRDGPDASFHRPRTS